MSFIKNHVTKGCLFYNPKFPEKYVGKQQKIICRSKWEMDFCRWLDNNSSVVKWASEAIEIPYYNPIKMRQARYYPDFFAQIKNKEGHIITWVIEVKPNKECSAPVNRKNKKTKTMLYEQQNWMVNEAKWKAATQYCKLRGWLFKLITEKQLYGN